MQLYCLKVRKERIVPSSVGLKGSPWGHVCRAHEAGVESVFYCCLLLRDNGLFAFCQ